MNRVTNMSSKQTFGRWPHFRFFAGAILGASVMFTPALAHQTFLLPSQFVWQAGDTVDVVLTSALAFPNVEHGPKRDRIPFTAVVAGGEPVSDLAYEEAETFLKLRFTPEHSGLALIAMSSKPRFGEIKAEDADAYFDEIGADAATRQIFDALPGSPALNRSYAKHTKTFICIENCDVGREPSYAPTGQALEFIAMATEARAFQLLRDGNPLAGQRVTISSPDGASQETTTNENGVVEIDASLSGVVMVSSIWITMPDQPDGVYHSDYATLTIDLANTQ